LKKKEDLDYTRIRNIALTGLIISPLCHYWFGFLELVFKGNKSNLSNMARLIVDQLLFDPFLTAFFFVFTAMLNQKTVKQTIQDLKEKFWSAQQMSWRVWPLAQFINFNYVPETYRVLFANLVGFFWGIFMAYKANSKTTSKRVIQP